MALLRTRSNADGRHSLIHVNVAGIYCGLWIISPIVIALILPVVAAVRRWLGD
jgi:hypothetical protein